MKTTVWVSVLVGATLSAACRDDSGVATVAAVLRHPEVLDFGRVPVGVGRTLELPLENLGSIPARILSVRATGAEVAGVVVMPSSLAVLPGDTASLQVRLEPYGTDEKVDLQLVLTTDIRDAPERVVRLLGQGIRKSFLFEPEHLDFGTVVRGQTSTRTLQLTSLLSDPVTPTLRIEMPGGIFETLDEPPAMEPGATASLRFRYAPEAEGEAATDRGTAVLAACGSAACESSVGLEGRAVLTPLRCRPSMLDFGWVLPGRREVRVTQCTNASEQPLAVETYSVDSAEFRVPSTMGVEVPPLGSIPVEVWFEPGADAELGSRSALLAIRTVDPRSGRAHAPLEMRLAAQVGGGILAIDPGAIDFGSVALGTEGRALARLTNHGDQLVEVTALRLAPPFSSASSARLQLAGGESVPVELRFTPLSEGPVEGELVVDSNAAEGHRLVAPLGGTGLDLSACEARWDPPNIEFGDVLLYRTTFRAAQVQNTGDVPCLVRDAAMLSSSDAELELTEGGGLDRLLEPGASMTFIVGFRPTAAEESSGELGVGVSNPVHPMLSLPISGSGVLQSLVFSPDEVDFGELAEGCGASQSVRVFNPGRSAAHLREVGLTGPGAGDFQVVGPAELLDGSGLSLSAGGSVTLEVSYDPRLGAGPSVATLELRVTGRQLPMGVGIIGRSSLDPYVTQTWVQGGSSSADMLLVIDSSNSMGNEQEELQRTFPRFLAYAEERGLDYRIAVITADLGGGAGCVGTTGQRPPGLPKGACGYFSDGSSSSSNLDWRIVDPTDRPSPAAAFAEISEVGLQGSAAEEGLRAATVALDPVRLSGWNRGFLARPDAFLGIVFVSDEDDRSVGDVAMYEALLAGTKGARFADRYAVNGIVIDHEVCGGGMGLGAERYLGPIARSGGTLGSICDANYEAVIDRMARAAAGLRASFLLRRPAFSPSVEVWVDRVPLSASSNGKRRWSFDRTTGAVTFEPDSIPREGSEVEIRYRPLCRPN